MKKLIILLSILFTFISCQKTNKTEISVKTGLEFVENNSMVKSVGDREDILDALHTCLPVSIPISAKNISTNTYTNFNSGETVSFKFTNYSFSTGFTPENYTWVSDICSAATQPFISISATKEFNESISEYIIPATYDCIALVVPASQCSGFKVYINSTWNNIPSVVSGDYRIIFLKANLEFANMILATSASDDYLQKTFNAPKSQTNNGKYFFFNLPSTSASVEVSYSLTEWEIGVW